MTFIPLEIPPGVVRLGTTYRSRGRWFLTQLVRWFEGVMQAVGGWDRLQDFSGASPVDVQVTGTPRAMLTWFDNARVPFLAIGTEQGAWSYSGGTLTEITPAGFTAGSAKSSLSSGVYGAGNYGDGPYGQGSGTATLDEADLWTFDNFGEILIAVFNGTGERTLYSWDLGVANDLTALTDSGGGSVPSARAVVVTPERFVVALAANGDGRLVAWSDQEDANSWTPTAVNQAGDFPLSSQGDILAGKRLRNETLIWTTNDLWAMRYIGGELVYSFHQVGTGCGAISRNAMATAAGRAIWMGPRGFFAYEGHVRPISSDVSDYVFSDLNRVQAALIWSMAIAEFREIWWFYPSAGSTECDRYVVYNWAEGFWYFGELERTAGSDRGEFDRPLMGDAAGFVYEHEIPDGGYLDTDDSTTLTPGAQSGPIELGNGDRLLHIQQLIPDEKTLGDARVKLHTAPYPTAAETEHGPFSLANPTDIRVTARQVRLEIEQVNPDWRVGTFRLDAKESSRR